MKAVDLSLSVGGQELGVRCVSFESEEELQRKASHESGCFSGSFSCEGLIEQHAWEYYLHRKGKYYFRHTVWPSTIIVEHKGIEGLRYGMKVQLDYTIE